MFSQRTHKRTLFFFLFIINVSTYFSQNYIYGEGPVNWELRKPFEIPPGADKYSGSDLVILSDLAEFDFYSSTSEKIIRSVKYKINTQRGINELRHYQVPESFDFAFDDQLHKQGRRARIKIPYLNGYSIKVFAARKFSRQRWMNVTVKDRYETLRWIKPTGEFSDENIQIFDLGTLAIGDVLEIYYEAYFNSQYSTNALYFNGSYPKLTCEYDFVYRAGKSYTFTPFTLPVNIKDSSTYTSKVDYVDYVLVTTKIQLKDLPANNYPLNSLQSNHLPHVCTDFSYYRSVVSYADKHYLFSKVVKPRNFEWAITADTIVREQAILYDKQSSSLKKFTASLPPVGTDSQNFVFARALSDTLNSFLYVSPNQLFYNESALYELSGADHLLKRRLAGHTMWKLYLEILKEKKLFYYLVNIQDKRFGEHDLKLRSHSAYERTLIALPVGESYVYLMPRNEGLKYHLNELPFYYEGTFAALIPTNFQRNTEHKSKKVFRIVKTQASSFADNARSEKLIARINTDSLSARLTIKESLEGQFSTLLRPLYLNEVIDSTVNPFYFKRSLDKPNSKEHKIKAISKSENFPYKYVFDCSEKIVLKDSNTLSLKNWFSFIISKTTFPDKPNYNYYFDFMQSDSYEIELNFVRATVIKNREVLTKKVHNKFFDLESELTKNGANNYLLKVDFVIKEAIIPVEESHLLMEIIDLLDQLNNVTLELARK